MAKSVVTFILGTIIPLLFSFYQCVATRQEDWKRCNDLTISGKDPSDSVQCATTLGVVRKVCRHDEFKTWIAETDKKCRALMNEVVPSCIVEADRIRDIKDPIQCVRQVELLKISCPYEKNRKRLEEALDTCNGLMTQSLAAKSGSGRATTPPEKSASPGHISYAPGKTPKKGTTKPAALAPSPSASSPSEDALPQGPMDETGGDREDALLKANEKLKKLTTELPQKVWL